MGAVGWLWPVTPNMAQMVRIETRVRSQAHTHKLAHQRYMPCKGERKRPKKVARIKDDADDSEVERGDLEEILEEQEQVVDEVVCHRWLPEYEAAFVKAQVEQDSRLMP